MTVPPGGQTVLLPQCHRMFFPIISIYLLGCFFFFPSPLSLIIWRCPQKAIYLFLLWLYDVFTGEAVLKSVQRVSSRMKKKGKYRYCPQAVYAGVHYRNARV